MKVPSGKIVLLAGWGTRMNCQGCGEPIDYTKDVVEMFDGLSWHEACSLPGKRMLRVHVVFSGLVGETLVELWSRQLLLEDLEEWATLTNLKGADRGDHSKVAMDFVNRSGLPLVTPSGLPLWRIAKSDEAFFEEADQTITVRCRAGERAVLEVAGADKA
jgi:hypothetical protein